MCFIYISNMAKTTNKNAVPGTTDASAPPGNNFIKAPNFSFMKFETPGNDRHEYNTNIVH